MEKFSKKVAATSKWITLMLLLANVTSMARDAGFSVSSKTNTEERTDRIVDRAAVQIQLEAISRIEKMISHPRVGARKSDLTFQLAMAYMESASLYFRIAHEEAARKNKKLNLSSHHKMMSQSIKTFDTFLKNNPDHELVPQALFLRGTAHDEISQKALAFKDFTELVRKFPDAGETSPAHMKLADYAVEDKDHARAVNHLRVIEGRTDDLHFPFALYKLAWANYNLKQYALGMDYLRRHISFYNDRIKEDEGKEDSDVAIRSNSLKDLASFFFEGYSTRSEGFDLADALKAFEKHTAGNPSEPVVIRFTALLRTRAQDPELEEWSTRLMKSSLSNETLLGALGIVFENQVNRRLFALMPKSMERIMLVVNRDRRKLLKSQELSHVKDQLEEGTTFLHKTIAENKKNERISDLMVPLAGLYNDLISMADENDPQIAKAYFNLAETYFDLKKFEKATEHYRIIVDKYPRTDKTLGEARVQLLAIASRFEELKESKVIPESLTAKGILEDKPEASLNKKFEEWTKWISSYRSLTSKVDPALEKYEFESIRVRYAAGRIKDSVEQLFKHLKKKSALETADVASVALVLDSYILSKDWESLTEIADRLAPRTRDAKLLLRFQELKTDSLIKLAEADFQKKDLSSALKRVEECVGQKDEAKNKKSLCEYMQAKILLEKNGFDKALPYLNKVVAQSPEKKLAASALGLRAQGYLAKSDFDHAIPDLLKIVNDDGAKGSEEKIFRAVLMTNNLGLYSKVAQNSKYCESAVKQCLALSLLIDVRSGKATKSYDINQVQRSDRDIRSLMAVAALPESLKSFQDTRKMLGEIGDNWSKLDPQIALQISSSVLPRSKPAFGVMRGQLKHYFRVSEDPASVKLRIDRLKNYEQSAESLSKGLGWRHIHVALLKDVANAYQDFASEVPVEEFRAPLLKKAAELEAEESRAEQELALSEKIKLDAAFYKREFGSLSEVEKQFLDSLVSVNLQAASLYLAKASKIAELEDNRKVLMEALLLEAAGARFEALSRYNGYMSSKVVAKGNG